MKTIQIMATLLVIGALTACGNTKTKTTDKKDSTVVENKAPVGVQKVELKFVDKGTDKNETPHNDIILSVDGKDTIIAQILSCDSISKADYKSKEIPVEATTAIGGWYAGAGEYFYAYIKDGKAKVFYGWQSEEQTEEGYHWKEMDLTSKTFDHYNIKQ